MTKSAFSPIIDSEEHSQDETSSNEYVIVNVRPGPKLAAMIDLLCEINGKTPSALLSKLLSDELAEYAAMSKANAEAIKTAALQSIAENISITDGALGILYEKGILEHDGPLVQAVKHQLDAQFKRRKDA